MGKHKKQQPRGERELKKQKKSISEDSKEKNHDESSEVSRRKVVETHADKEHIRNRLKDARHHKSTKQKQKKADKLRSRVIYFFLYAVVTTMAAIVSYYLYDIYLIYYYRQLVVTPLDTPLIIPKNMTSAAVSPERFWGSYRPQNYFGLKTRSPKSMVVGLMWFTQFINRERPPQIRHWCDQGDNLLRYSWAAHDGVNFGDQEIWDRTVALRTIFVKRPGGDHGGDWSAKIIASALPVEGADNLVVSLMFYAALDDQGRLKEILDEKGNLIAIKGHTEELGYFELTFPESKVKRTNYLVTHTSSIDKLKEVALSKMAEYPFKKKMLPYIGVAGRQMPDGIKEPNFILKQLTATVPFEMDIVFESKSNTRRPDHLFAELFNDKLLKNYENFFDKFERVFGLKSKGFPDGDIKMARSIFSNTIGGIGYFSGTSKVQSVFNPEPVNYWPTTLYTGVPSRSFFPRGFLWDEGFHNLLISEWDPQISKEIIGHWLDTINAEGWIPREQILGKEAQAKVPDQFIVQNNRNANPPTFFLPLQKLVKNMVTSNDPSDKTYLKNLFPRLKAWYSWYNTTQHGSEPFTYRWHGRNTNDPRQINPLTLTSGLDDYPRSSHPTNDERHVDLYCWMALASSVMADIAKSLSEPYQEFEATYNILSNNELLDKLHWSSASRSYADYGLHTDKISLVKPPPPRNLQPGQAAPKQDKIRLVHQEPKKQYINAFGYISLFPFLLQIVNPNSPKLEQVLLDLNNTNLLLTRYGLRSLSKRAPLYRKHNTEHDPPYWRGQIWINMNFLAVRALHHYANTMGPYQDKAKLQYTDLRDRVINLILTEYDRTGYIWENYDDLTGEGKGSHPFTGWSSLVVMLMAEKY